MIKLLSSRSTAKLHAANKWFKEAAAIAKDIKDVTGSIEKYDAELLALAADLERLNSELISAQDRQTLIIKAIKENEKSRHIAMVKQINQRSGKCSKLLGDMMSESANASIARTVAVVNELFAVEMEIQRKEKESICETFHIDDVFVDGPNGGNDSNIDVDSSATTCCGS